MRISCSWSAQHDLCPLFSWRLLDFSATVCPEVVFAMLRDHPPFSPLWAAFRYPEGLCALYPPPTRSLATNDNLPFPVSRTASRSGASCVLRSHGVKFAGQMYSWLRALIKPRVCDDIRPIIFFGAGSISHFAYSRQWSWYFLPVKLTPWLRSMGETSALRSIQMSCVRGKRLSVCNPATQCGPQQVSKQTTDMLLASSSSDGTMGHRTINSS